MKCLYCGANALRATGSDKQGMTYHCDNCGSDWRMSPVAIRDENVERGRRQAS